MIPAEEEEKRKTENKFEIIRNGVRVGVGGATGGATKTTTTRQCIEKSCPLLT
jgi:hypothetical protein